MGKIPAGSKILILDFETQTIEKLKAAEKLLAMVKGIQIVACFTCFKSKDIPKKPNLLHKFVSGVTLKTRI